MDLCITTFMKYFNQKNVPEKSVESWEPDSSPQFRNIKNSSYSPLPFHSAICEKRLV